MAVASPVVERATATPTVPPRAVASASRGKVLGIEPIRTRPQGSGVGAVAGGVLGAVVGNQFGHGSGRTAMTAIGAAGGAVAGNNVERNYKTAVTGYRVRVALDNGQSRTFEAPRLDGLHVGDRVRVEAGRLHRL
ncbi:MAG: glycine zipper 2TM domain-containing protein [Burkholderiaceae bacterium]